MATALKKLTPQKQQVDLFSADKPEWVKTEGPGLGNENVTVEDLVLPRLEIIQSESPIKGTVPEATEGMLFNTLTGEIIGESAHFIPIYFRVEYILWKMQDFGGGFFGAFNTKGQAEDRRREKVSDGENVDEMEIVDTPVQYGMLVRAVGMGEFETSQIVISMAKSKAKVSRKWNAMIQIGGGDRFSRVYRVSTFKDKNKQNKSFFNFVVIPAGFAPEKLYHDAALMYKTFSTQPVRGDYTDMVLGEGHGNDPEI